MKKVFTPFTPVIAYWEDASVRATDQHGSPEAALSSYSPCYRRSLGYFVGYAQKDGREALILATDDDRSRDEPASLGGPLYIPIGMLLSIGPVCPPNKQRKR